MMTPPTNTGKSRDPEVLTGDELDALLGTASRRSSSGVRLRALIGILYGAGLRISEALALKPRDVDIDGCTVRVRNGKGGKARHVAIRPLGCALLDVWMTRRADLRLTGHHAVFAVYSENSKKFGKAMSDRQARQALARLGEKAGVEKSGPVHPHMFRHTLADEMRRNGRDIETIRKQLGHSSLAVTGAYLDHLSPRDLVDALDWD